MVMGPQILTAIFLVTSKEPVKNSVAMLVGVLVAASLSILIWFGLYEILNIKPGRGRARAPRTMSSPAFWRSSAFTCSWAESTPRSRSG